MPETVQALKDARALIADPDRWTRGEYARTANGARTQPADPRACRWCAVGALAKVLDCSAGDVEWSPIGHLLEGLTDISVSGFNDYHEHAEVLAKFDEAIAAVERRTEASHG